MWAPSAAKMMEEAWKSGRQVCRLLLAMDRWKSERFRIDSSLGRRLEAKRVSTLKNDSQVAIVRSVLNSVASIAQKFKSVTNEWIFGFYMKPFTHEKGDPLDGVGLNLGHWWRLGEEGNVTPLGSWLEEQEVTLAFGCDDQT